MCYTKIDAYKMAGGRVFEHERDAIADAIEKILGEEYNPLIVMDEASKLIPLLKRSLEIKPPAIPQVEAPSAEPERTPEQRYERRSALLGRIQAWGQIDGDKAKGFITSGGYQNLSEITNRATDEDIEKMHVELTEKGVA